jgi:hypothetical protein
MAYIESPNAPEGKCAGSLVAPGYVLTAAQVRWGTLPPARSSLCCNPRAAPPAVIAALCVAAATQRALICEGFCPPTLPLALAVCVQGRAGCLSQ